MFLIKWQILNLSNVGWSAVHFDRKKDDLFKNQLGDNTIAK